MVGGVIKIRCVISGMNFNVERDEEKYFYNLVA